MGLGTPEPPLRSGWASAWLAPARASSSHVRDKRRLGQLSSAQLSSAQLTLNRFQRAALCALGPLRKFHRKSRATSAPVASW
ncbi:uncharacterized protein UV8b_01305 [Ustilaginoidea virens]|uniref:Uncharacterized protein n=1 Tax=Ustilaginoidea virens TaxID=1159556 RepID=A0A8E5HKG9_USTVR|nr:uncharacterized protein UV8b_01305 [Ustilaginoidea virens]QUC17064.1 hypothetical protein UV8b_01305 [Ustilaginoidea virens]